MRMYEEANPVLKRIKECLANGVEILEALGSDFWDSLPNFAIHLFHPEY